MWRPLSRILGILALGYAGICGVMAAAEPWLVYPAPTAAPERLAAEADALGAEVISLQSADGTGLSAWRTGPDSQPLVLHFSGNGSRVGASPGRYGAFADLGYSALHLSYRGYPGSEGSPSEAGLVADAQAAWDLARRTHAAEDIVIHGHSLGGGVAVALAAALAAAGEAPRALVTENTFSRAWGVAAEQYPYLPVRWLMRNGWDSLERAPAVDLPALVLHGLDDRFIPPHHGEALAAALPRARFLPVPGAGHNEALLLPGSEAARALEAMAGPAVLHTGP